MNSTENLRPKKLLLSKQEISKISQNLKTNNFTMIPLNMHFNKKGICKNRSWNIERKKKIDKREYKKDQDWKRQKERLLKK